MGDDWDVRSQSVVYLMKGIGSSECVTWNGEQWLNMRFCTDVCLECRIVGVPAEILRRYLPKTNQKPHRLNQLAEYYGVSDQ
jgi:hypothetical protein